MVYLDCKLICILRWSFPSMVGMKAASARRPLPPDGRSVTLESISWAARCGLWEILRWLAGDEVARQLNFFGEPMADLPAVNLEDHLDS